ncbi:MAG: beta-propeller fold lactonase family protein, partial [Candidatus Riflebacteria bacterium]|nr:beta-propeller fold lactonase family protein [Candidatus Riflebacteria bacterium]
PVPAVDAVDPTVWPGSRSTAIKITGRQFGSATAVLLEHTDTLNRISLSDVNRRSATEITATVPAGMASGFYNVYVRNRSRTGTNPPGVRFTATRPPMATSVNPASGVNTSATLVTIGGEHLAGVTAGILQPRGGGTTGNLSSIQVATNGSLTAIIPRFLKPGRYDIILTNASGSGTIAGASFEVTEELPAVYNILPSTIQNTAVRRVTILGQNLSGARQVRLENGVDVVSVPPAFVTSSTSIVADIPAYLVPGPWSVRVQNSAGLSLSAVTLTITEAAPILTALDPTSGLNNQTITVRATGANFLGASAVTLTGPRSGTPTAVIRAPTINKANHTTLTFTVPPDLRPGEYDVKITNTAGTSGNVTYRVTEPAPELISIIPPSIPNWPDQLVTLSGKSLWGATLVTLTGPQTVLIVPAPPTSNYSLSITVPARIKPGQYTVTITNSGGSSTGGPKLTVTEPLPEVYSISPPASAPNNTTRTIVVNGDHLLGAWAVRFDGPETFNLTPTVLSDFQVTATIPPWKIPGIYDVRATNTTGTSTSSVQFSITELAPVITALSPPHGPNYAATDVTVTGSNLLGAQEVQLTRQDTGDLTQIGPSEITIVDRSTIRVRVPPALFPAYYSFRVRNTQNLSNALTYQVTELKPALTEVLPNSMNALVTTTAVGRGYNLMGVFQFTLFPDSVDPYIRSRQTARSHSVTGPNTFNQFPVTIVAPIFPGPYRATAVNTAGRSDFATAPIFTVTENAPYLQKIEPNVMPFDVTTLAVLTGTGLYGTRSVRFEAPTTVREVVPETVHDDTRISVRLVAPMTPTTYTVTVLNTNTRSNGLTFTVTDSAYKDRMYSSSMAITPDNKTLFVANGSVATVTCMQVGAYTLTKQREIAVGSEPTCIAMNPQGTKAYVTNRRSGTVSVIDVANQTRVTDVAVGTEPIGCVFTPTGRYCYVANSLSKMAVEGGVEDSTGNVVVIDSQSNSVVTTIGLPRNGRWSDRFPFAMACTNDGDSDDLDEKVYVTEYFGQPKSGTRPDLRYGDLDTGRTGRVLVISVATNTVVKTIQLADVDTGFTADRTLFGGSATSPTRAWPNLLSSIFLRGNRAYVVNSATSPEGPAVFDSSQQAVVSVIDTTTDAEVPSSSVNLNRSVKTENAHSLNYYFNTPWSFAMAPGQNMGYLVCGGSDLAVRVTLSSGSTPIVTGPPSGSSNVGIVRVPVGKNPRSVLFNTNGSMAFVHNYIDRSVSLINPFSNTVADTESSAALPDPTSAAGRMLRGEELFTTSRGTSSVTTANPPGDRMSEKGWMSCFGCHPFGWTDMTVWSFWTGPRKTIPLNAVFAKSDPADQRVLMRSAVFDEVADSELKIRHIMSNVADSNPLPPHGLIVNTPGTSVPALRPTSNTINSDWRALEEYVRYGIRSPISPFRGTDVSSGRAAFVDAGCVECHGGPKWSSSTRLFLPPPPSNVTVTASGEVSSVLRNVDSYSNTEKTNSNTTGLGAVGFNPPSLLGIWAFSPFLHQGQALDLDELLDTVINSVPHKNAGVPGYLDTYPDKRQALVKFLKSIDDTTATFSSYKEPQYSSSMAITPDGLRLFVANQSAPTVTYMSVQGSTVTRLGEITVGNEPWSIAVNPQGTRAYVTNRGSGTVSVIDVAACTKLTDITVGTEPCGCALTATGKYLYVANSMSNDISIVDTDTNTVKRTIALPTSTAGDFFPFAVAITNNGNGLDNDEKVYVTQYFGQLLFGSRPNLYYGDTDTGRAGKVTVISTATEAILKTISLNAWPTGFTADRTAFGGGSADQTSAFPNLLGSICLWGNRAYVPNSASSPQGPVRYDVNQHAFVAVIDTDLDVERTVSTQNLNYLAKTELGYYFNVPWGMAIAPGNNTGYILSAGSNVAVKVALESDGTPRITGMPGIVRIEVGKNPRSIIFNRTGIYAYVHNYIDRSVAVIDAAQRHGGLGVPHGAAQDPAPQPGVLQDRGDQSAAAQLVGHPRRGGRLRALHPQRHRPGAGHGVSAVARSDGQRPDPEHPAADRAEKQRSVRGLERPRELCPFDPGADLAVPERQHVPGPGAVRRGGVQHVPWRDQVLVEPALLHPSGWPDGQHHERSGAGRAQAGRLVHHRGEGFEQPERPGQRRVQPAVAHRVLGIPPVLPPWAAPDPAGHPGVAGAGAVPAPPERRRLRPARELGRSGGADPVLAGHRRLGRGALTDGGAAGARSTRILRLFRRARAVSLACPDQGSRRKWRGSG